MRNITIAVFALLISAQNCYSQVQELYGPTTVYITDALGNKDSVNLVWLDRDSNINPYDLGERNILHEPWDTLLEARLSDGVGYWQDPTLQSKVYVVENVYYDRPGVRSCPHSYGGAVLLVHAMHPPVTISWDSAFYDQNYCFLNYALVNHDIWSEHSTFNQEAWEFYGADSLDEVCMSANREYITDLLPHDEDLGWTKFTYDFPLDNGDTVTHGAMAIIPDVFNSCDFPPIVNTTELPPSKISVHPNPVTDHIIVLDAPDVGNIQHIRVVDITGQVVIDQRTDLPERLTDYILPIANDVYGLVIVQVVTGEGTWTEKVLVE